VGNTDWRELADDPKVRLVLKHIDETIGLVEDEWITRPTGYPEEIEAALLDSVFSLRARYGASATKGPRAVVRRWREQADRPLNDLGALVAWVEGKPGQDDDFRRVLKNDGVAVPNARDKPTKALAVYQSAKALVEFGVVTAADAVRERQARPKDLLKAIQKGRGVGPQATTYFLMNLGEPGVKADVWVMRFVDAAIGDPVPDYEAAQLVTKAAQALNAADVIRLDHAIWDWERRQSA
jgi:hypothetical protein